MIISPLDESLPAGWSRPSPPRWFFLGYTEATLRAFLNGLNLFADEKADLLDTRRWQVEATGVRLTPRPDTILSLDPETRGVLYAQLANDPENQSYHRPWSLNADTFEQALEASELSPDTRDLIRSVAYPVGNRMFVADGNTVIDAIASEEERLRVLRFIKSAETYKVDLAIEHDSNLQEKLGYWGDRTSQEKIRPILESIRQSAGGGILDIIHLLPVFARDRLYTYPEPVNPEGEVRRDCHWSSLNFFYEVPDDRFGRADFVQNFVIENYFQSSDEPAFGDIIFFSTRAGSTVHSAVYLAGDMVFTKNGDDIHQPWVIMDVDDIEELYSAYHHVPVTRQTWKRKEKVAAAR